MKFLKTGFFFFTLLLVISASGQDYRALKVTDSIPTIKERGLCFLEPNTDLDTAYFTSKILIEAQELNEVMVLLQKASLEFSANSFKLITADFVDNNYRLELDLYNVTEDIVSSNFSYHEKNSIYFLGSHKTEKFKLNKEKISIKPGTYFKYLPPKGKRTRINKGGFTGMTLWLNNDTDTPLRCFTFGGIGLLGYSNSDSQGVAINTGKIYPLDEELALLMINVLDKINNK